MMNERVAKQFTPSLCMLLGAVFLISGIIWQLLSDKALNMYAFFLMAAAILWFTCVIMTKASGKAINPIKYLIFNMVVLVVFFWAVIAADEIKELGGTAIYVIGAVCFIAGCFINTFLLKCDSAKKKALLGFLTMLLNVVLIGIVFMIPVLLAAFGKNVTVVG